MRAATRGSGGAPGEVIEINFAADKVYGRILPAVRDWVVFVIDLDWFGGNTVSRRKRYDSVGDLSPLERCTAQ